MNIVYCFIETDSVNLAEGHPFNLEENVLSRKERLNHIEVSFEPNHIEILF